MSFIDNIKKQSKGLKKIRGYYNLGRILDLCKRK